VKDGVKDEERAAGWQGPLIPSERPENTYGVAFSHSWMRSDFLRENWSSAYNNKEAQANP
jgi:hypothetical protein